MTIAPLTFCTVVVGIGSMKSMKAVGKAGGLALLYFEIGHVVFGIVGIIMKAAPIGAFGAILEACPCWHRRPPSVSSTGEDDPTSCGTTI